MTEKYVKLSDVKDVLEKSRFVTGYIYDGELKVRGYVRDDIDDGLAELLVYEFEDPDTQNKKTEKPVLLCKYRNEDRCGMYCNGFDTTCEDYDPVEEE